MFLSVWKSDEKLLIFAPIIPPSFPANFLFFDYCWFQWDTQREPLRRREVSFGDETMRLALDTLLKKN